MSPGIRIPGRTSMRPLTGSQVPKALAILRTGFPNAEITAAQQFEDGGGAIIQFHDPTRRYGAHATIIIRWDEGCPMFAGHYFDDEFAVDVDFLYRSRRGY